MLDTLKLPHPTHTHLHTPTHDPGLALEIATAAYPQNFLLLASLGNFSKAVGKGMGKPVFRCGS